jgi:hypothetical protein
MKSICFAPIAFCLLSAAYCIWGEFELAGPPARTAVCDKMSSPAGIDKASNFRN